MEGVFVVIVIAAAAAAVLGVARATRPRDTAAPVERHVPGRAPRGEVVLDVAAADPAEPALTRLVTRAAEEVLLHDPDLDEVVVRARDGTVLGRRRRPAPLPPPPPIPREPPRRSRTHVPTPVPHVGPAPAHLGELPEKPRRTLAERFELPSAVQRELRTPDDATELVRAILAAAGLPAEIDGHTVRCGDVLVVVVGHPSGLPADHQALNEIYLWFRDSGARRGLVISLRALDHDDVRRRELLAPELTHHGPDALQRMADAVAVGADPLSFAVDPLGWGSSARTR